MVVILRPRTELSEVKRGQTQRKLRLLNEALQFSKLATFSDDSDQRSDAIERATKAIENLKRSLGDEQEGLYSLGKLSELKEALRPIALADPGLFAVYAQGHDFLYHFQLGESLPRITHKGKSGHWKLHFRVHEDSYPELAVAIMPILNEYVIRHALGKGFEYKVAGGQLTGFSSRDPSGQLGKFITAYIPRRNQSMIPYIVRDVDEVVQGLDLVSMYDYMGGGSSASVADYRGHIDWIRLGSTNTVTLRWASGIRGDIYDAEKLVQPIFAVGNDFEKDEHGTIRSIPNPGRLSSLSYIQRSVEYVKGGNYICEVDVVSHLKGLKDVRGGIAAVRMEDGKYLFMEVFDVSQEAVSGWTTSGNGAWIEVHAPIASVSDNPLGVQTVLHLLNR